MGLLLYELRTKRSDLQPGRIGSVPQARSPAFACFCLYQSSSMRRMISSSVCFMPNLAKRPTVSIVLSTPFLTRPSPPKNALPLLYIDSPMRPASTATEIFAAQLALAPSQTIPELIAIALTTVCATASTPRPCRYAMPAPAPQPALTAPQYAESLPIPVLR